MFKELVHATPSVERVEVWLDNNNAAPSPPAPALRAPPGCHSLQLAHIVAQLARHRAVKSYGPNGCHTT